MGACRSRRTCASAQPPAGTCGGRLLIGVALLGSTFLTLGIASSALAEPILASAGVLTRVVVTDNLFLTGQGLGGGTTAQSPLTSTLRPSSGANRGRESGTILQLLPNITGGHTGPKASYRFYYGPSAVIYGGGNADLNRVFHVLQANASLEVVKEYFSLQLNANANQNLVNPAAGNAGFTALGNPDAYGQTASIQITPMFQFPFLRTSFAKVRLAPGFNYMFAAKTVEGNNNSGSAGTQSSLSIISGDDFPRLAWQITGTTNLFNNANNTGTNDRNGTGTSDLSATVTYPLSDQWRIQGLVGYDWGNYTSLSQPNGFRWRVTPYWSPSPDTSVGLGYGYRYNGADYYANIRHRYKNTSLTASYEVDVSNARTSILNSNTVNFQDAFGQPITAPLESQTLSGSAANPALASGFFIQKQLLLGIAHKFGRTTASLNLNNYHWDYQNVANQVEQNQGTFIVQREISRRASGSLGLQFRTYNQSAPGAVDYAQVNIWSEFTYQISRRTQGSIRYSYNHQSSATPSQNFDENSLWLTLNWTM